LDIKLRAVNGPSVYADSVQGTLLALDHLWNLGHRNIICVSDPLDMIEQNRSSEEVADIILSPTLVIRQSTSVPPSLQSRS
jgi:DNA-binding LacI/PurR family transcriptional regulator